MKELAIKIRHRCNTKEKWEAVNPVLDMGEMGVQIPSSGDTDNPDARWFFKFGDGKSQWKDLPWASADGDFQTDPYLQEIGAAADAYYTGLRIEALELQMEVLNYTPLTLKVSVDGGATREKTGSPPTSVTLKIEWSGQSAKDNKGVVTFNGESKDVILNGSNALVTFSDLELSMNANTPSFSCKFEAVEEKCPGNGNVEKNRTATANLQFKDSVYHGYGALDVLEKQSATDFMKSINKIKSFGLTLNKTDTTPDPNGEYYYICAPAYYTKISVVTGENATNVDLLGEDYEFDYGNGIKTKYRIYRTKNIYTSSIKIGFTVS